MNTHEMSNAKLWLWALAGFLLLMGLGQWLLSLGRDFIDSQSPIDWAHWLILIGAVGIAASSTRLSLGLLGKTASVMIVIGAAALVGMAAIDLLMWAMPETSAVEASLDVALDSPGIAFPFLWVGPSLLFVGLALKGIEWRKLSRWGSALLLLGTLVCGFGQAAAVRPIVVSGIAMMVLGTLAIGPSYTAKQALRK